MPGTASGAQLSFSSPWGVYSLVCLILTPTCSPWPEDWGQAAWPTHTRQDLRPMCAWGVSLSCIFLSPVFLLPRALPEVQGLTSTIWDRTCCPAGCSRPISLGNIGSEGHSGNQATFSLSAHPDARRPSGAAGLKGMIQLCRPGLALPPEGGAGAGFLEGSRRIP